VVDFDQERLVFSAPPSNGFPALLSSNAQSISIQNGCDSGIYKKVPGASDLHFCAGDDDIYGTWSCDDLKEDHDFAPTVNVE
jgi:hypothetical protein